MKVKQTGRQADVLFFSDVILTTDFLLFSKSDLRKTIKKWFVSVDVNNHTSTFRLQN